MGTAVTNHLMFIDAVFGHTISDFERLRTICCDYSAEHIMQRTYFKGKCFTHSDNCVVSHICPFRDVTFCCFLTVREHHSKTIMFRLSV